MIVVVNKGVPVQEFTHCPYCLIFNTLLAQFGPIAKSILPSCSRAHLGNKNDYHWGLWTLPIWFCRWESLATWIQVMLCHLASRPESCLCFVLVSNIDKAFVYLSVFAISGITSFLGEFMFCLTWLFSNSQSTGSLLHTLVLHVPHTLLPITVHPHIRASNWDSFMCWNSLACWCS